MHCQGTSKSNACTSYLSNRSCLYTHLSRSYHFISYHFVAASPAKLLVMFHLSQHSRNDPPNIVFISAIHHPPSGPPNSLLLIHPLHRADIALFPVSCASYLSSSSSHSTPDPSSLPPDHRHFHRPRPRPADPPDVVPQPGPQRGRRKGCRSEHGADRRHR